MDNDKFVKKLIKGTKDDKLEWKPAISNKLFSAFQPFYIQKGDKKLVLEKYTVTDYDGYGEEIQTANCSLSICNDNFDRLSEIYEDDLKKSNDIWRLYRLAERQANNVDDIMESFVEDIDDIDF